MPSPTYQQYSTTATLGAGVATVFDIPNHHLSYAGTWFGLAGTLAGVFGYFMWRRRRG